MRNQPYQASQDQQRTAVIQLADGRLWRIPTAAEVLGASDPSFVSEYLSLLQDLVLAGDLQERRLGELALTIHLLDHEFRPSPHELRGLLTFAPGSKEQVHFQEALHVAYLEHIRQAQIRQGLQPAQDPSSETSLPDSACELTEQAPPTAWISALASRIGRLFYRRVSSQKGL